jgi:hypothetical protein
MCAKSMGVVAKKSYHGGFRQHEFLHEGSASSSGHPGRGSANDLADVPTLLASGLTVLGGDRPQKASDRISSNGFGSARRLLTSRACAVASCSCSPPPRRSLPPWPAAPTARCRRSSRPRTRSEVKDYPGVDHQPRPRPPVRHRQLRCRWPKSRPSLAANFPQFINVLDNIDGRPAQRAHRRGVVGHGRRSTARLGDGSLRPAAATTAPCRRAATCNASTACSSTTSTTAPAGAPPTTAAAPWPSAFSCTAATIGTERLRLRAAPRVDAAPR